MVIMITVRFGFKLTHMQLTHSMGSFDGLGRSETTDAPSEMNHSIFSSILIEDRRRPSMTQPTDCIGSFTKFIKFIVEANIRLEKKTWKRGTNCDRVCRR